MHFLHPSESSPYDQVEFLSSQLAEQGCLARAVPGTEADGGAAIVASGGIPGAAMSGDPGAPESKSDEPAGGGGGSSEADRSLVLGGGGTIDDRLFGDEWLEILQTAAEDHLHALGSAREQGIEAGSAAAEDLKESASVLARRWLCSLQVAHSGPVADEDVLTFDQTGKWVDGVTAPACDALVGMLTPSLCRATLCSSLFGRDAGSSGGGAVSSAEPESITAPGSSSQAAVPSGESSSSKGNDEGDARKSKSTRPPPLADLNPDEETERIRVATEAAAAASEADAAEFDDDTGGVPDWSGWASTSMSVQTEILAGPVAPVAGTKSSTPVAKMTSEALPFGIREPWFGAWVRPCPVPASVLARWKSPRHFGAYWGLALPPANAWIPDTLELRSDSDTHVQCQ